MATVIRFDYFHLKVDKKIRRQSNRWRGTTYFGGVSNAIICENLLNYFNNHTDEFNNRGKLVSEHNARQKWINWFDISQEGDFYKLLFSFNDQQVDDRIIADRENNSLAQRIPETHGQRTMLHIIIKARGYDQNEPNICIQHIPGLTKAHIKNLFENLLMLIEIDDPNFWQATDPVTEEEVECKPVIEITPVTTDDIVNAINDGLLRGVKFAERTEVTEPFDTRNRLSQSTKILKFRLDEYENLWQEVNQRSITEWVRRIREHHSHEFEDEPRSYLIIKHPQTGSEVNREIFDDTLDGFAKKHYIAWEDREVEAIRQINSQEPIEVSQFYREMIEKFN